MPGMPPLGHKRYYPPVNNPPPPATDLRLVVGYDGSPPASRALAGAVNLLQGRSGRIYVVYVAHMASMAELSPGFRAVLSLYLFEGYDQEEIAGILGVTHATVRTQYIRGKAKLLQIIQRRGNP